MIFSKSLEAPIKHVRHVLRLRCDSVVTIKLNKCEFLSSTMNHLVHIIHSVELAVSQHTVEENCDLEPLTIIWKLRPFLALRNLFCHFVPNFAHIVESLDRKLLEDKFNYFGISLKTNY